ncbi:MAG: DNA recombination/repair protein RecA [Candidatus Methylomirabilis sp.]|nr:DNA recombination/repair protein RecA [Candidatus Methylomirabilis sp.]
MMLVICISTSPIAVTPFRYSKREAHKGVGWSLEQVAGRLVEISGAGATASLTLAFGLVLQAQRQNEPVAWITRDDSLFYPPDAAEGGVDLDALVIVRVSDDRAVARAADQLIRSGAFGLVVLDLGTKPDVPAPLQIRLAGLAHKHQTALLCLTAKGDEVPSLGPLVSLRVTARRERLADDLSACDAQAGRFACGLTVLKDKRRGPTWRHMEVCCGPAGLR